MVLDVQFYLLEDLTLDIFADLFLFVPSGLESFVQYIVFASQEDDEVEIVGGEDIWTVKIQKQSSGCNIIVIAEVVEQFLFTELRHIELGVPIIVKFVLDDDVAHRNVGEVQRLVEQLTEGSFSCSWCAGDKDVWCFSADGSLFDHCCRV